MGRQVDTDHEPEGDIAALEKEVGVEAGFFKSLLSNGDDWSFVIKIHALVEAAVSHLLTEVAGHPNLQGIFSQLELSNNRTGKVAFARSLGCLNESERLTIRKLSELRNALVHDVSKVSFAFGPWADGLDRNQLTQFAEALGPGGETIDVGGKAIASTQFFKENPRISVWFTCLYLLSLMYQRKDLAALRRDVAERGANYLGELIRSSSLTLPEPSR